MRTVLKNNSEVAHIWAQQKQKEGRAGHLFFEDKSIYSYGRHFEIARFVDDDTVLFTTRSYSNATAKHKHQVERAISHKDIFYVPQFEDHNINVSYYLQKVKDSKEKALKAIAYGDGYCDDIERYLNAGLAYVGHFKVNKTLKKEVVKLAGLLEKDKIFSNEEKETLKRRKLSNEKRIKTREDNLKIARAQAQEKYLKEIEDWKNGIIEHAPYSYSFDNPVVLRVKDDRIETSKGAQVTVKTALRLWEVIKAKQSVEGFKLDNYEAHEIKDNVLTVGCHHIPLVELERIAGLLGV